MITSEILDKIGNKHLTGSDLDFFKRVWTTDLEKYKIRLENIGFNSGETILDAGCGSGQWSVSMSKMFKKVFAIDINEGRVKALEDISNHLSVKNLDASVSGIESLNFESEYFDCVFCYSVIFFTDVYKSIAEFSRVLKSGGKLYINANGLGWYLHNMINTHNSNANFDSRQMAIETIENTLNWAINKKSFSGQVCVPSEAMCGILESNGFKILEVNGDGLINLSNKNESISFFQKNYFEKEGVYEILAQKK